MLLLHLFLVRMLAGSSYRFSFQTELLLYRKPISLAIQSIRTISMEILELYYFPILISIFCQAQETKEKLVWIKSRIAIFRLHSTKSNWRERERDFFRVNDIKSPVMLHLSINQYLFVTYKILDSGNAECSNMVIFCTCSNRISIVERIQHNSSKRI